VFKLVKTCYPEYFRVDHKSQNRLNIFTSIKHTNLLYLLVNYVNKTFKSTFGIQIIYTNDYNNDRGTVLTKNILKVLQSDDNKAPLCLVWHA
jgi:hypothetical protein